MNYIKRIEETGAKVVDKGATLYIELPTTVRGMRDLMLILLERPTPDEVHLRDCEGLEPGNTLRVWWD